MSVRATLIQQLTLHETLSTGVPASPAPTITHSAFNRSLSLTATTTPAVTKCVALSGNLTAGAATIDLTSMTGANGTVTFSGLRVQGLYFENRSSSNAMIIKDGASNGYLVFGDSSGQVTLGPGGSILLYAADYPSDVSGSVKTIDLTGTGTDAYYLEMVAG